MEDCVELTLRVRHQLVKGSQASHPPALEPAYQPQAGLISIIYSITLFAFVVKIVIPLPFCLWSAFVSYCPYLLFVCRVELCAMQLGSKMNNPATSTWSRSGVVLNPKRYRNKSSRTPSGTDAKSKCTRSTIGAKAKCNDIEINVKQQ